MTMPKNLCTTMAVATAAFFISSASSSVSAFSSMPIPTPSNPSDWVSASSSDTDDSTATTTTSIESSSWRIVLDIGREPLATGTPFDWARSGCRMPLKVPADFVSKTTSDSSDNKINMLQPLSDTVSCTGPDGAIVRAIEGGIWKFEQGSDSEDSTKSQISFELKFPEGIERRDVYIEAGQTLECIGTCYTSSQLQKLQDIYKQATEEVWALGEELNDASKRQNAPKRWNDKTQRWEKAFKAENPLDWASKRFKYMAAKANQQQKNSERPDLNDISNIGSLPGLAGNGNNEEGLYIAKEGIIRSSANGAVMGRWSAEPIVKY